MGGDGVWHTGPADDRRTYRIDDATPVGGGHGFVFAATRTDGAQVALKLLDDVDAKQEQRLRERVAAVRANPHPNVAEPLEVFRGPGLFCGDTPPEQDADLLFIANRWIEGSTLRAAAPLAPGAAATAVKDLASALEHLHGVCGLVHRDLHPGNVVVAPDGHATLIDLGSARPHDGLVTRTVSGVLGFIPPECTRTPGDHRSDAWSLGMVAVHALLGHPVGGEPAHCVEAALAKRLDVGADPRRVRAALDQLLSDDPAQRRTDLVAWADDLADAVAARNRRQARPLMLAAAVAITAALGIGAMALAGGPTSSDGAPDDNSAPVLSQAPGPADIDHDDSTSEEPSGTAEALGARGSECPHRVGETADEAPPLVVARARHLTESMLAVAETECATGPVEQFVDALHQELGGDGAGSVVVASDDGALILSRAEWQSYREIAGRQRPENATELGGYPVRRLIGSGLETHILLSRGGIVIGPRADTQSFWMPSPVLDLWESLGGIDGELGLPVTNPYLVLSGLRQDFERGYLHLTVDAPVPFAELDDAGLDVHLTPDVGRPLDHLIPLGAIVRQPTATAWWIDETGRRRWIPDGETWSCLGGHDRVAVDEVSGAELATLPLGPPASCDLQR